MNISKYKDIFFVEKNKDNFGKEIIKEIEIKIDGIFCNSQLKSLSDVKESMYKIAKENDGNAIINFTYGQHSTFWRSILGLDNIFWYGKGSLINLSKKEIEELLK